MKKLVWRLALFSMAQAVAILPASSSAPKPDANDYNITAHVSAAQYAPNALYQLLTVTIDGKHYQMQGPTSSAKAYMHGNGLLNPGDYHVKLIQDTHKTAFESIQEYEFLLPDNITRKFGVIAQSE